MRGVLEAFALIGRNDDIVFMSAFEPPTAGSRAEMNYSDQNSRRLERQAVLATDSLGQQIKVRNDGSTFYGPFEFETPDERAYALISNSSTKLFLFLRQTANLLQQSDAQDASTIACDLRDSNAMSLLQRLHGFYVHHALSPFNYMQSSSISNSESFIQGLKRIFREEIVYG